MDKKINIANWNIVTTSVDYKNRIFEVQKLDVIRPDGVQTDYYVLDKQFPFAIVIPVTEKNTFIIVGQYRVSMRSVSWEFPMGSVPGKIPLEIAKQELKEETGFTAEKYTEIGHFFTAPGHTNSKAYVFVAEKLTKGDPTPEENEFFEIREVGEKEFEKMIHDGIILDGPTIAAYYYYKSNTTT